jgi:hypothetical protein
MISPPPSSLTEAEIGRLEIVALPAPAGEEAEAVYRFADTGEFVAEDDETAAAILKAFPSATIQRV